MEKIDLRKQYKKLYNPSARKVEIVDVPPLGFAMVDGRIEPGQSVGDSPDFQAAVSALYTISYTLKFMLKKRENDPIDYPVMALQGLWGTPSGQFEFGRPDTWLYTAMIMQPDIITLEVFAEGLAQARRRKPEAGLDRLRLETFHEGRAVQMMHIGPYADEPATIGRMVAFMDENDLRPRGLHHEIYMSDPLKTAPERMKTVLRHPVE